MNSSGQPSRISIPWAYSGTKRTIPNTSQIGITPGAASFPDGFPPLTFAPLASGGVPPAGADFNGILNAITAIQNWQSAGGGFTFDAAFATAIGGYPKGATLANTAGDGYWLNLADANSTDPNGSTPANWFAVSQSGAATIALTNANVTLTPAQYGKPIIILTGALTANVQITFPPAVTEWTVVNSTSGAFTVSAKTASGTPVICGQGLSTLLRGDGTNVLNDAVQFNPSVFAATLSSTGSQTFPSGLIRKWGTVVLTTSGASVPITFAAAFPSACYGVSMLPTSAAAATWNLNGIATASGFNASQGFTGGTTTYYWEAWGK